MNQYQLLQGDCREVLKTLPDNSVDSIVTDPPYELGFMGKAWDATGVAYDANLWREAYRVLKPGGHILSFGGSRTYHRMACAIEDAGFEIRDQLMWVYGSGFPKSHNISKAMDKSDGIQGEIVGYSKGVTVSKEDNQHGGINRGAVGIKQTSIDIPVREPASEDSKKWEGWGTALKPAHEPIVLARKPLEGTVVDNVRKHGVGGLNIDGCRVPTNPEVDDPRLGGNGTWKSDKMAANVYEGGYEGKDVSSSELGRFPANLIHDNSEEVRELFPESNGGAAPQKANTIKTLFQGGWNGIERKERIDFGSGSAARFFFSPKPDIEPEHNPIVLARKPLDGTVVENVKKHGVGGLNIDGCRVSAEGEDFSNVQDRKDLTGKLTNHHEGGNAEALDKLKTLGRFPANLLHDGSQQVMDLFPKEAGAAAPVRSGHSGDSKHGIYGDYAQRGDDGATFRGDKGSAARFFYCAKASKKDRDEGCEELPTQEKPAHMRTANGEGEPSMTEGFQPTQRKNTHPTVKPTELMRYLVRLITPKGGLVLDPFNGSGSTGKASMLEGMRYIGIEMNPEYIKIAEARISNALKQ